MDRNQPRKSSHQPTTSRNFALNPTRNLNYSKDLSVESSHSVKVSDRNNKVGSQRVQLEEEDGERDYSNAESLVGTCPFMCPEKERSQRERLRDLAIFERLDGNPRRTSSSLAVKKFCRTISTKDVHASDLRPLPVLEDTLNYLMKLLDSSAHPFEVVHDFIFDRTRSIRQDLSMQNIINDRVIWMYERMVKFHIISHHKLRRCKGDATTLSSIHHLNREQLTKCLASLYNLYDVNRNSDSIYDNEAEFRSLYILLNLDSHGHSKGESLSLWFSRLPSFIIRSKEVCFARRLLRLYRIGNFWQFFCTVASEVTYLQFCIIEPYINEVRAQAVACVNASIYKLNPYPLANLSRILRIKESDLEFFCNSCGLETSQDDKGNKVLPTKQTGFCQPKEGFQYYDFLGLELLIKDSRVQDEE